MLAPVLDLSRDDPGTILLDNVFEIDLGLTCEQAVEECRRRGLTVRSERALAGRGGGRHWHLGFTDRAGTLELSCAGDRVWLKVHPLRDGGWAAALAQELAAANSKRAAVASKSREIRPTKNGGAY